MKKHFPPDPNCPLVVSFSNKLSSDPMMEDGVPTDDSHRGDTKRKIMEAFAKTHHLQCQRCREYASNHPDAKPATKFKWYM
jgi:hypothetical protein